MADTMADTWVTDITHYLDEDGRLPDSLPVQARRLAEYLGSIVVAVTSVPLDDPLGIRCRRRPGRKPCRGDVAAYIVDDSSAIRWICPACEDNGFISGWSDTIWDCRASEDAPRH